MFGRCGGKFEAPWLGAHGETRLWPLSPHPQWAVAATAAGVGAASVGRGLPGCWRPHCHTDGKEANLHSKWPSTATTEPEKCGRGREKKVEGEAVGF